MKSLASDIDVTILLICISNSCLGVSYVAFLNTADQCFLLLSGYLPMTNLFHEIIYQMAQTVRMTNAWEY